MGQVCVKKKWSSPILHSMEVLEVRGGTAPRFLTLALDGGEWSVSCSSHVLAPGKGPPVPTGQEAGWASGPV
jgi:hypothetical protein